MLSKFIQIFKVPELRNRVLVILGILVLFRLLAAIPVPGVNPEQLKAIFNQNELLGFLNIFSGGALSNLSIVMLGLGPYITATIIMQLLTMIFPKLKAMYYEEGTQGRAKFNRISRFITVPLAGLQAFGFLKLLQSQGALGMTDPFNFFIQVLTVTAGSMILVWLGEIITEQKFGNGVSLIIFGGIVTSIPTYIIQAYNSFTPDLAPAYIGYAIVALIIVTLIVIVNEAERRITINYAKRIRGNKVYGGASSYLPLKVNQAGVIPIIFAISILVFPQFIGQIAAVFSKDVGTAITNFVNTAFSYQSIYGAIYFLLVFMFTYFYISVTFDPAEISKNLQRNGGFIPGIRPGDPTTAFLKSVISRITVFGATFLGFVAVLPIIVQGLTGTPALTIGGTAILIVVSVAIETAKQIDSQLTVREYETIQ